MTLDERQMTDPTWWRQAVIYQIYPRSFADSDGDGIGDLRGITSRLDHLRELGVDAVWLSPFYPSALADGGYDVDDYRAVDPRLGTLEDFDAMVAALHEAGIKVIVDIVPNHCSDRHAWFTAAIASPKGSPERERFIFRDSGPDGGPPNSWGSVFGGPAWHQHPDDATGQWYFHIFALEQPDLNWENPEVRADFLTTLRFWSDRGVDGFRVDVAHALIKDVSEPWRHAPSDWATIEAAIDVGDHPWFDQDAVHEIYADWRKVFDEYDPPRMAVAEAGVPPHRRVRFASPLGLGQAFNFDLLWAEWDPKLFRDTITTNLAHAQEAGASTTWVLSNHDVIRHPSRYGLPQDRAGWESWLLARGTEPELDRTAGLRKARATTLMLLGLPGSTYLYQGEELGLHEVADLPDETLQDPTWERTGHAIRGRDGCRVPLPWQAAPEIGSSYGFGPGGAHLPQPGWYADVAVDRQEGDPGSTLQLYRRALALRSELLGEETMTWHESEPQVLDFERPGGWRVVMNFGDQPIALPEGVASDRVVLRSAGDSGPDRIGAFETVWIA